MIWKGGGGSSQETSKSDRIRGAHAQKHSKNLKPWIKYSDTSGGKNPGFAKHFKLAHVTSVGIMRVMANGKDILVQPVLTKVRHFHILRKIATGPKSQKTVMGCPGVQLAQKR